MREAPSDHPDLRASEAAKSYLNRRPYRLVPQLLDGPDQFSLDRAGLAARRDVLLPQRPGFLEIPHSCLILAIPSRTQSAMHADA
jgi:hypothetical protein